MDLLNLMQGSVVLGLEVATTPLNLFYCFFGVLVGMFVGVLPGLGPLAAMSMLFPLTFGMDATSGLIMLAGIYYGTAYGGSTAAILLNVPGIASGAVSCIDGYPMAKQGRGGIALLLTTFSSFVGGSIGIILMMLFAPLIVQFARNFGAQEYFALILMGLVGASGMSSGSVLKSFSMIVLGLLFGTVGMDMYSGAYRLTLGVQELSEGIGIPVIAMGIFGVAEIIVSARIARFGKIDRVTFRSMIPTREDWRRSFWPTLRGTGFGSFFGALPGTGALVASFVSYAAEKRIAKDPTRFGKGAVEGICAPEAANNAADQTAFIPTLTLGIPGSATMALMLGVLLINGIAPGPRLFVDQPDMFWGLVMSFWIGNLILVFLNIPLIGLWVSVLRIPYHYLYPSILVFICIGVFSVSNSVFDIWLVIGFGALGYLMRQLNYPAAPMLLGFILGPLFEENFRRSMLLSRGDIMTFLERPISAAIIILTIIMLFAMLWGMRKRSDTNNPPTQTGS